MIKKVPSFIRIRYHRKRAYVLITIFLIVIISFVVLIMQQNKDSPSTKPFFQDVTNQILRVFNETVALINSQNTTTPTPSTPTPSSPTTTPITAQVTPKPLLTTDATRASTELSQLIFNLKQQQLPSIAVEDLYLQGKDLLEKGQNSDAFLYFKQGYDLAQEILTAGEYYKESN